jgi:alkanesulfonate monooxygenase SsuD/methylene tetrahydromethanopterin reductase-like flavin-dependent oxidoreductase (luciferase family)
VAELRTYGFSDEPAAVRAAKLRETLDILALMFGGEPFDYEGTYYTLRGAQGRPVPVQPRIPVHIGGGGALHTMPLVRDHADWWNCPGYALDRLDELRPLAGHARISAQHPIGLAANDAERDEVTATVQRRFGSWGGVIAGTSGEVADALAQEVARGVEGFVCQFGDFGAPATIERFMTDVASEFRR